MLTTKIINVSICKTDFLKVHAQFIIRKKTRSTCVNVNVHRSCYLAYCCFPGTLAPSLVEADRNSSSIDVIFATYWFYPAKTKAILPDDQRCIDDMMDRQEQRFDVYSTSRHSRNSRFTAYYTRCSAIAERPRCRVCYSFRQK